MVAKRKQRRPEPVADTPPEQQPESVAAEPVYSYPTRARCPKCGSTRTRATSTPPNGLQWRRCAIAWCRHTWKVPGTRV